MSLKLDKFLSSYTLDMKLLMEKTTENCILNDNYLKYGDEVFKKDDILPAVITPSMIYHKKSLICDDAKCGIHPHMLSKAFNKKSSSATQREPNQDEESLRQLVEEKQQLEEKLRKLVEKIGEQSKTAGFNNQFLPDIANNEPEFYKYDENRKMAANSCVTSLRNVTINQDMKSRSDGLIKLGNILVLNK